jgi:hypothetical protein
MPKTLSKIFNPAGGLTYHFRALRYKKLWRPFCEQVERWLNDWSPQRSQLILIGPSAGYTLPRDFLARFQSLVVVDPDPAAFMFFQSRFLMPAVWVRDDFFALESRQPQKIRELFSRFAGGSAAFLFCNILGQLPVLLREQGHGDEVETYMRDLGKELREAARSGVAMASYHDRYSQSKKRPGEIIDHLTGDLFAGASGLKEFPWQLTPALEHHVEFWRS